MKLSRILLITGCLGVVILTGSYLLPPGNFLEIAPQVAEILEDTCDCQDVSVKGLDSQYESLIEEKIRQLIGFDWKSEQGLACANALLEQVEKLGEKPTDLEKRFYTLRLKYYGYFILLHNPEIKGVRASMREVAEEELELANRLKNPSISALANRDMMIAIPRGKKEEDVKFFYLMEARKAAAKTRDTSLLLNINKTFQRYALAVGDYRKVNELSEEVIQLAEDNEAHQIPRMSASINLGMDLVDKKIYEEGETHLMKAYGIAKALDNPAFISEAVGYLLIAKAVQGKTTQMAEWEEEWLRTKNLLYPNGEMNIRVRIVEAYRSYSQRDFDTANELLEQLSTISNLGVKYNVAELRYLIAREKEIDVLSAYARMRDIKDSLNFQSYSHAIDIRLYEKELRYRKMEMAAYQKRDRMKNVFIGILGISLTLILILLFLRIRQQRKIKTQNQQITSQNKSLTTLNENLQEFSRIASHDLRDPIQIIHLHTQIIESRSSQPVAEWIPLLHIIRNEAKNMRRLLDDFLAYSQGIASIINPEHVDLNKVLTEVNQSLKKHKQQWEAQINVEALPTIYGSRTKLYQIFKNLISNAIAYHQPGIKPEVSIQYAQGLITVKDNGQGIPKDKVDKIFEAFFRGNYDRPGSGLGLSIVKKCVESHEGKIWFETRPGEGTTFFIRFPEEIIGEKKDKIAFD